MRVSLKTQLVRLLKDADEGKDVRQKVMDIYRQRPEYITKEGLVKAGIIIKKAL